MIILCYGRATLCCLGKVAMTGFFLQLLSEAAVNNNTLCVMSAISTHYFLLAAFMWMLIEGIFLYFYVIQVGKRCL